MKIQAALAAVRVGNYGLFKSLFASWISSKICEEKVSGERIFLEQFSRLGHSRARSDTWQLRRPLR